MNKNIIHPKWGVLYLLCGLILGVFWQVSRLPWSRAGHTWAEAGLIILLYGLVMTWLKANEISILLENQETSWALDDRKQ